VDGSRWVGSQTRCVIFGDDAALAAMLIWSLPITQFDGYLVFGSSAIAHLARLPGCLGVIEADLAAPSPAALAELARRLAGYPAVAIPADDAGCDLLARTAHPLFDVVPLASPALLATLRDKWTFHQLCRQLGLPTPETRLLGEKSDIDITALLADLGGKVVIKPTNQHGGQGVVVLDGADGFRREVRDNPAYDFAPLIGQTWVPGRNLCISLLARDGEILHCAMQRRGERRTEFLQHDRLFAAVTVLVRHTGFSGLANFDARLEPDGQVFLLECNPRPWASLGQSSWAGLNFVRAAVEMARGGTSSQPALLNKGFAPDMGWWWLRLGLTPWRWRGLPADRKRLALGMVQSFTALGWAGRWRKIRARLNGGEP